MDNTLLWYLKVADLENDITLNVTIQFNILIKL